MSSLDRFGPATRAWFQAAFAAPTPVQEQGWPPIASGDNALLLAPTGSGKTLAAFLACLDRLTRLPPGAPPGVRVLYVSPLKALVHDVERNLRAPLAGIARAAEGLGEPVRPVRVSLRTGDTSARDRRAWLRTPGDVLVTTPESLFLLLGSKAREHLRTVETVIVDEIHALAPSKRGMHLALSLERLAALCERDPQRIGLSATQRPLEETARFLGGDRPVQVVDASAPPALDLEIGVPVPDMTRPVDPEPTPSGSLLAEPPRRQDSIWPAINARVLELVRAHRSTIVFANSRLLCERLTAAINELAGQELARAHHGSVSREQRAAIEDALKAGRLPAIVATSSLELGIDMGAVDLVVQIASPGSVASGLQRVGRAGHSVGLPSRGRILPKHRGDLLECAVVAREMQQGRVETTRVPRNGLDVLAQQVVSMVAVAPRTVDEVYALVRRSRPYADLGRAALVAVLDMLSGRYPSEDFADLRPRITWDRVADRLTARRGAGTLALLNAGTIPDRGLYTVHVGTDGPRIGELDEEMVFESRRGDRIVLGASTWRIDEITRDRVVVSPAPGEAGRLPFWRGDHPGRPSELGVALGGFLQAAEPHVHDPGALEAWLREQAPLDAHAARNLAGYLVEQVEAVGALPGPDAVVVERFRDELGDWRVCIHSPFGRRVNAAWALALRATLGERLDRSVYTDDGIVLRVARTTPPPAQDLLPEPEDLEDLILSELGGSALYATRFREAAGRALLLPRRRPGKRTPLWAQRLRAQELMKVAQAHPSFPIVLEAYRECLQDVLDVRALGGLMERLRDGRAAVHEVETPNASPFARSLLFAWVGTWLYEGDTPAAERRAQALTLDRELLRELLGHERIGDLLVPDAVDEVERALQRRTPERAARHADAVHDLLRTLGALSGPEIADRAQGDPAPLIEELVRTGRIFAARVGGAPRFVAVEDAALYRDALGVVPAPGIPRAFLEPASAPLEALLQRHARTHGPFTTAEAASRLGLLPAQVAPVLRAFEAQGRLVRGRLRPGGPDETWCDADVLRRLRRASLAHLRAEIAPVDAVTLGRFLPAWHGVGGGARGVERLRAVVEQLEGLAVPVSALESEILPARIADFTPRMLDELGAMGEVVWVGCGPLGKKDGRVALYRRDRVGLLLDPPQGEPDSELERAVLAHLQERGASFLPELQRALPDTRADALVQALWGLVWAGLVTNDTFQPLRTLGASRRRSSGLPGGRWGAVAQLVEPVAPTLRAHARAESLLTRYGVVAREMVTSEGLPGGYAGLYDVLCALEQAGRVRRGHFVSGLGGAQFARPGVVDRLRARRDPSDDARALAVADPACPWGAVLPWPATRAGSPRRVTGATVVCVDGAPVLYVKPRGRAVLSFADATDAALSRAARVLLDRAGRYRTVRVDRIDGEAAAGSALRDPFLGAGFVVDGASLSGSG